MAFEIGDVVRLKSGGPLMTVYQIEQNMRFLPVGEKYIFTIYETEWFKEDAVLQRDRFDERELIGDTQVAVVSAPRPVLWEHLKRDLDLAAEDILKADLPDSMMLATELHHLTDLIDELHKVMGIQKCPPSPSTSTTSKA